MLGAAWMVGALSVLEDELGVDLREFDELVGTSAGSVLAALLGAGVSVADLRRHQLGEPLDAGPLAGFHWDYDSATGGDLPRGRGSGSAPAACCCATPGTCAGCRRPRCCRRCCPRAAAGWTASGALVRHVVPERLGRPVDGVRIVAMDYESGQRVPFGGAGRARGRPGRRGDGVVRDPGVVPAGPDRRPALHRRRRLVGDQRRPDGRARPGRGVRGRADGELRDGRAGPARRPGSSGAGAPGSPGAACTRSPCCTEAAPTSR